MPGPRYLLHRAGRLCLATCRDDMRRSAVARHDDRSFRRCPAGRQECALSDAQRPCIHGRLAHLAANYWSDNEVIGRQPLYLAQCMLVMLPVGRPSRFGWSLTVERATDLLNFAAIDGNRQRDIAAQCTIDRSGRVRHCSDDRARSSKGSGPAGGRRFG